MMIDASGWQMQQFAMKLTRIQGILEISTQQLDAACMGFTASMHAAAHSVATGCCLTFLSFGKSIDSR